MTRFSGCGRGFEGGQELAGGKGGINLGLNGRFAKEPTVFHPGDASYFLLNISISGVGMNFMTVSTMLSSSSSSPQPVGTAFLGRVRLPSEACSMAAAASASFSSFFLMPYWSRETEQTSKWEVSLGKYGFQTRLGRPRYSLPAVLLIHWNLIYALALARRSQGEGCGWVVLLLRDVDAHEFPRNASMLINANIKVCNKKWIVNDSEKEKVCFCLLENYG